MSMNKESYFNVESSLIKVRDDVEKLTCLIENLCEYFSVQDVQTDKEKQYEVIFQYNEMRLFSEISMDYINKLNNNLNVAWNHLEKGREL